MKYIYIFLILFSGVVVGRWSAISTSSQKEKFENWGVLAESKEKVTSNISQGERKKVPQLADETPADPQAPEYSQQVSPNRSSKHIRDLFGQFMEANNSDDLVEQNRILAEIESLDPKNEKAFQAKAMILQDDDNWNGAQRVLEDCVVAIPSSVFCLRRLANIRTSTTEQKLRYGTECLRVSNNDPLCLVDVALALNSKGEFVKAKVYFELALRLPQGSEGYHRDYILYSYANTLEGLNSHQQATEVLVEACRLGNKAACEKIKT